MEYITRKFGDVGEMALLSGGPRQRGAEQGECQRFMISEKDKLTGFKEKTEMAD